MSTRPGAPSDPVRASGDPSAADHEPDGLGERSAAEPAAPPSPAAPPPADAAELAGPAPRRKGLTIGAVCKQLSNEFPDVSISKIRYLEDQKLLTPKRTPGGYRLYSQGDVSRLRTILRLQRDEFLPLRVIRQELAKGITEADVAGSSRGRASDGPGGTGEPGAAGASQAQSVAAPGRSGSAIRRSTLSIRESGTTMSLEEVIDETGISPELIRELEDFGIVGGTVRDGTRHYNDTEREIIRACTELARYGVAGRNLRVFKTSADREAMLLQQILAPALRSRNPERRREAVDALENLAAIASHLKHLLLVRDLRRIANP